MRTECLEFLQASLMETITRLLESKQSAELNPNKMDSPEEACSNAEYLLQTLDQVGRHKICTPSKEHTIHLVYEPRNPSSYYFCVSLRNELTTHIQI